MISELATGLHDQVPLVRLDCAMALSHLGPKAQPVFPTLLASLEDRDNQKPVYPFGFSVRQVVVNALGQIGPEARDAVPAITAILREDPDEGMRCAAARALGNIGPEACTAIPTLLDSQKDTSPSVSRMATDALSLIDSKAGKP